MSAPAILVFDSGVGGLTVLREIRAALPQASFVYVADNAAFPYGAWDEAALADHVIALFGDLVRDHQPDLCVIACNTASTLVLPGLRAAFALPFVGTVPAIKPAVAASRSRMISVLGTPGTVARDYTKGLIKDFAGDCQVMLVGAAGLAAEAEARFSGGAADAQNIAAEIAPAFVEKDGRRTDTVVLACTHYPLLTDELRAAAPWEVDWIDPAPAIARRVVQVLPEGAEGGPARNLAIFTDPAAVTARMRRGLAAFGLESAPATA